MSLNNVKIIIHHLDFVSNQTHMEKIFQRELFFNVCCNSASKGLQNTKKPLWYRRKTTAVLPKADYSLIICSCMITMLTFK